MCYAPINKCSKSGCSKESGLPIKQCEDAKKRGKNCRSPEEVPVPKQHRQLCKKHNNGKDPGPISSQKLLDNKAEEKAKPDVSGPGLANPNVEKAATFPIDKKMQQLSISEKDSSNESSRSSSKTDKARGKNTTCNQPEAKQSPEDTEKQEQDKSNLMAKGYVDNYRGYDCRPVKLLAPEPAEWQQWRENPPSEDLSDYDSRNGRWGRALMAQEDRAWPLPYEEFHAYVSRQGLVLGRSMDEFPRFNQEYYLWMIGDRQFHSADMTFLCKMMLEEINATETYYKLQKPEPLQK